MESEASYICDTCGEDIVIPIDFAAGPVQEYVEDCPVCCHPCVILVRIAGDGSAEISVEPEQDHF